MKKTTEKKAPAQGKKRVVFELNAEPGIDVFVAGTFNNWDISGKQLIDKNSDGNYRGTLMLPPGNYEYKFYVNSTWCVDPSNPNFTQNELGTLNSVLIVE